MRYYALGDMEQSAELRGDGHARGRSRPAGCAGDALMRLAHPAESIPFFLRAVELDPNFASAYTSLSRIYSNLGEAERAESTRSSPTSGGTASASASGCRSPTSIISR